MAKAKLKAGGPFRGKARVKKMGMNSGRRMAQARRRRRG